MNHLVETPQGPKFLDGTGYLASCFNARDAFADDDNIAGVTELVNAGLSLAGGIIDPIGWLASSVAGWVMEHVEPLREWLEAIAGSPSAVEAFAGTWHNIGEAVTAHVAQWRAIIERDLADWDSAAVNAFRDHSNELVGYVDGLGELCTSLSDAVFMAARVIDATRSIIRDLIATTIGTIISVVVDCAGPQIVVLGGHAVTVVVKHVTTTTYRLATFGEKLTAALIKMGTAAKVVVQLAQAAIVILSNVNANLAKLAERMAD